MRIVETNRYKQAATDYNTQPGNLHSPEDMMPELIEPLVDQCKGKGKNSRDCMKNKNVPNGGRRKNDRTDNGNLPPTML